MNCIHHPRCRVALLVLFLVGLGGACDSKKPATTKNTQTGLDLQKEAEVVAALDSQQDQESIRKVLQQLDSLDEHMKSRTAMTEDDRTALTKFFPLTESDWASIKQSTYSQGDAAYVEECLLLRTAMRGLNIDQATPTEQARQSFAWVMRMVYLDERIPWPAPAWSTLHGGSAISLSRAYAVLAAWQQLKLDGCFVGPSSLTRTASRTLPQNPGGKSTYAPVRACGVLVGDKVLLFDPTAGTPIWGADGKSIATLDEVKTNPKLVEAIAAAEEVKTWQPCLSVPLNALAKRMQALERLHPANINVILTIDLISLRERFLAKSAGRTCVGWNPPNDAHAPTRVIETYFGDEITGKGGPSLRDLHRVALVPLDALPKLELAGGPLASIKLDFGTKFEGLRWAAGSPRDYLLRGMFKDATAGLMHIKSEIDRERNRLEQGKEMLAEFNNYAERLSKLWADVERAKLRNDLVAGAEATKTLEAFAAQGRGRGVQRVFVMTYAVPPLSADLTYLLAVCVQERAERADAAGKSTKTDWENAHEWWNRYRDASQVSAVKLAPRDQHAQEMHARCQAKLK